MTSYKIGDSIVFIDLLKIKRVDAKPVNIPPGTSGFIRDVTTQDGHVCYTVECTPSTTARPVSFLVASDDEAAMCMFTSAATAKAAPRKNAKPVYDEDMPGFLRDDDAYLLTDPGDDEQQYLFYQRAAWTPWKIEVRTYPGGNGVDEVVGVFRTAWGEGQELEQFTLLPADGKGGDYAYVQVQMFKSPVSRVLAYAHIPAEVDVDTRKKSVVIHLLCRVAWKGSRLSISELPE
jgi:hypothetical protein